VKLLLDTHAFLWWIASADPVLEKYGIERVW
jgi:PIN domain nuclease of toxin-antitoxin system